MKTVLRTFNLLQTPFMLWLMLMGSIGIGLFCSMVDNVLAIQLTFIVLLIFPAILLAEMDSKWLLPYITFVWAVTPEIRRVFEWYHEEYQSVSLFSVVPLLTTLFVILPLLRIKWRFPLTIKKPLCWFLVALGYGLIVGIVKNGTASLFDFANYLVPFLLLIYCIVRSFTQAERKLWIVSFVGIAVLVSIYGAVQFFFAPPWDTFWMNEVDMFSNGLPEPYQIRVFSSLNSPGPAAMFISAALIAMLVDKKWRGVLGWSGVLIVTFGLITTLVRAAWVTMLIGIVLYFALSSIKKGIQGILLIMVVAGLGIISLPVIPGGEYLIERLETLSNLGDDYSYNDRLQFTASMIPELLGNPFGSGLGSVGTGTKLENGGQLGQYGNFDNGFFAILLTFGFFGGIAILGALYGFMKYLASTITKHSDTDRNYIRLALCAMISGICYLMFENRFAGVGGYIIWFFVALGMEPKNSIRVK
ncbi:O-antigen ligase family protein [Paenibacillus sp.]|uniref:O-antigen ligase family protein n=1 Tax=Paenibacillus sp. TaxID=58172 RepID=UPI003567F26E